MRQKYRNNETILMTGGSGLVGRVVHETLINLGYNVLNLGRKKITTIPPVDLSEKRVCLLDFVKDRPSLIIHLAAAVPHAKDLIDDQKTADLTRNIDANVYSACKSWGCPIIYSSTCGLYQKTNILPRTENNELHARTPYFSAKKDGEKLFSSLKQGCTIARLSSVYDAGVRENLVMGKFIWQIKQENRIRLWGSGQREQDFIHTGDIAEFITRAMFSPRHGIYNVASGHPISMRGLAQLFVDVVGSGDVVFENKADPLEAEKARYSIEKSKIEFDWCPKISLEDGLRNILLN